MGGCDTKLLIIAAINALCCASVFRDPGWVDMNCILSILFALQRLIDLLLQMLKERCF